MKIYKGAPTESLQDFTAKLSFQGQSTDLTIDQFLYRGAKVKNSQYIIAIIVYAGIDTKIS
jgi:hypothetical protein